ncbi:hypothetical protein AB0N20_25525 [Streptomyces griseoincarnatus]|nr:MULTISPECIES: hypothetical protein [Streptomyces]MDH3036968.1 hypothetical protein [Streptomyces sp. TRM75561]
MHRPVERLAQAAAIARGSAQSITTEAGGPMSRWMLRGSSTRIA